MLKNALFSIFSISISISNPVRTCYYIGDTLLSSINEKSDFRVVLSAKFIFHSQLNYVITNFYSMLAFIRRFSSDFTDPYALKPLFTYLLRSKLEYAVFLYRPNYVCHIKAVKPYPKKVYDFGRYDFVIPYFPIKLSGC